MARNYSIAEAVSIIRENKDVEAIADIGKRYPLLAVKIAVLVTKAPDEAEDLFGYVPSHVSANKINKAIKDAIEGTEEDADDDVEEDVAEDETPTPKKKAAPKKAVKKEADSDGGEKDFDSMTNKEMYNLLGELGERKACKEEFGDLSKKSMVSYLKAHHGEGMAESADTDDDWGEEEEATNPYEGKSAMELFKLCKERKIKAAPKKPAKFYIDLLMKADAEAETEDADDGWDDDEEEEEAPKKKPAKKAPVKKAAPKKAAKKAPEKEIDLDDDDDDDEWDI